ncbi:hypothetical protein [Sicyoidochytrium minutum DNA virus]|nr:hypothetical protein [Sicyoidochytrium minutum DNA virus]
MALTNKMYDIIPYEKLPEKVLCFEFNRANEINKPGLGTYHTVACGHDFEPVGSFVQGPPMLMEKLGGKEGGIVDAIKLLFEPGQCVEHHGPNPREITDWTWKGKTKEGEAMFVLATSLNNAAKCQIPEMIKSSTDDIWDVEMPEGLINGYSMTGGGGIYRVGDGIFVNFLPKSGPESNVFDMSGYPLHVGSVEDLNNYWVVPIIELPTFEVISTPVIGKVYLLLRGFNLKQIVLIKSANPADNVFGHQCRVDLESATAHNLIDLGEPEHNIDGDSNDEGEGEQL